MRLNPKALALTCGLLWGATLFLLGCVNFQWPDFGSFFLLMLQSLYPGYRGGASVGSVLLGTVYGVLDGALGGLVVAWVYNFFARRFAGSPGGPGKTS